MAKSWPIPNFNPDVTLSTCLRQVMKTRCLELFSVNQGLRDGSAEAIHDARITLRRLLVLYSIFKGCFKKKKLKPYKVQLKSLHKLIGKVREYDVQMGFLEKYLDSNAYPASAALALLNSRYKALRSVEHKKLIQMLDKLNKEDFQDKFLEAIDKALI